MNYCPECGEDIRDFFITNRVPKFCPLCGSSLSGDTQSSDRDLFRNGVGAPKGSWGSSAPFIGFLAGAAAGRHLHDGATDPSDGFDPSSTSGFDADSYGDFGDYGNFGSDFGGFGDFGGDFGGF